MGENIGRILTIAESITKAGCGAGRAYIGLSDDGSIGEGTDGRSIYHTMAEDTD